MNKENSTLMKMARESLEDRWALYWGIFFKYNYHNYRTINTSWEFYPYLYLLQVHSLGLSYFLYQFQEMRKH